MNFPGNFILRARVDVAEVKRLVLAQTAEDWSADAWRQESFKTHADTQTISLVFDDDFRHSHPTALPKYAEFEIALAPIIAELRGQLQCAPDHVVTRILLVRLNVGGRIRRHRDHGYSLRHSHRVHLPIVTNDGIDFVVGGESKSMGEGELWEINNMRLHEVANNGTQPRDHIIIDMSVPVRGWRHAWYLADRLFIAAQNLVVGMRRRWQRRRAEK